MVNNKALVFLETGSFASTSAKKVAQRIQVSDMDDEEYLGNITIGTPEQQFRVSQSSRIPTATHNGLER